MTDRTINKIISKSPNLQESLLDLTSDSVSPENLLLNETAHNNEGEGIVGTMPEGGTSDYDELENRPQINGNLLTGNKTGSQLGLQNRVLASTLNIGGQIIGNVEGALSALNESKSDLVNGKVPVNELPVYQPVIGSIQSIGGIVPPSSSGDEDKYLRSDGTWAKPAGGGGGVSDYDDLTNRPKVNGTTLSGDKTGTQLGLQNIVLSSALSIGGQTITEVEPALHALNNKSGGGGHTIVDEEGTELTQRSKLQFNGAVVSDDETNNATVVETVNPVDYEEDIYGVNLLNLTATTQTINGVTFTVNKSAGTITANGTATANVDFQFVKNAQIKNILKVGESYIFTTALQGGATGNITLRYKENGTFKYISFNTGVFTAKQAMVDNGVIAWWVNSGQTVSNVVAKPMLRKATIKDDTYRPYNQQSIQHQLTDQTNVLGAKNWAITEGNTETKEGITFTRNSDDSWTVNGTASAISEKVFGKQTRLKNGCTYTLSDGGVSESLVYLYVNGYTINNNWDYDIARLPNKKSFTVDYSKHKFYTLGIYVGKGQVVSNKKFSIMLRLASDPDDTYVLPAMTNRELTEDVQGVQSTLRRTRKNITSSLSNLSTAVSEQDLGKYGYTIGDYFTGASGYTYTLADMNTFKGTTTPYCITGNHLGIVVVTHATSKWHTGSASSVGYNGSTLHSYLKGTVLTNIKSDLTALFGDWNSHLLAHSKLLTTATAAWGWQDGQYISALTCTQVDGGSQWTANRYQEGEASKSLELFRKYKWTEIFGNEYVWLRNISNHDTSAGFACRVTNYGDLNGDSGVTAAKYVAGLIIFN